MDINDNVKVKLTDVGRACLAADDARATCEAKDREISRLLDRMALLQSYLARYRDEVPLGYQPHMLAYLVDDALGRA